MHALWRRTQRSALIEQRTNAAAQCPAQTVEPPRCIRLSGPLTDGVDGGMCAWAPSCVHWHQTRPGRLLFMCCGMALLVVCVLPARVTAAACSTPVCVLSAAAGALPRQNNICMIAGCFWTRRLLPVRRPCVVCALDASVCLCARVVYKFCSSSPDDAGACAQPVPVLLRGRTTGRMRGSRQAGTQVRRHCGVLHGHARVLERRRCMSVRGCCRYALRLFRRLVVLCCPALTVPANRQMLQRCRFGSFSAAAPASRMGRSSPTHCVASVPSCLSCRAAVAAAAAAHRCTSVGTFVFWLLRLRLLCCVCLGYVRRGGVFWLTATCYC